MIRTLSLTCSRCGKVFSAQDHLYYQDDFSVQSFHDIKLVCDDCIRAWKEKWQIDHAEFHEHNYVLTVTITLQDGTVYDNMDCTPMEDTESVITGEDIPPEAQHALYEYYVAFARQQEAQQLKDCFFSKGEDGKMVADLTTVGGEQYDKLVFSVEEGYLGADAFHRVPACAPHASAQAHAGKPVEYRRQLWKRQYRRRFRAPEQKSLRGILIEDCNKYLQIKSRFA